MSDDEPSVENPRLAGRGDDYNPRQYVPDVIDQVTASGLEEMHDSLNAINRARLEGEDIAVQAHLLWEMVEKGAIDLDMSGGTRGTEVSSE